MLASQYRLVVRDLAPERLIGRDGELAELREFCAGDRAYGWWQGDAWAGKSALLAWFVLHPPPKVEVVCYFVSRRTGRNTYDDCTDTLLRQLCDLTGEVLDSTLSIHERDEHRRRLLAKAATTAHKVGRRLVLVIDGLDEDAALVSNTTPTIASMLPPRPPPGLRIVVASRPATPIPAGHPLAGCDPVILTASAHATQIRDRAMEELREFLGSGGAAEQIVGSLAAAQGGLTGTDLSELTGEPPYRISALLDGSRIVMRETSISDTNAEPAYVLGHDELRAQAVAALGAKAIDTFFCERIHRWAAGYRDRGWPHDTPMYLLHGYSQMLAVRQDLDRLIQLALDDVRHDRMLAITGGDGAALAEIRDAQRLVSAAADPELRTAYRLVRHRDKLAARSRHVPAELPALWFTLGHPRRAEALAEVISDEYGRRSQAMHLLGQSIAQAGRFDDAAVVAASISDHRKRALALSAVAATAAQLGDPAAARAIAARAEEAAQSITVPHFRAETLGEVAGAIAQSGDHAAAREIATSMTKPVHQARVLAAVADALAQSGDHAAGQFALEAAGVARSVTNPGPQAYALAAVADALAHSGDYAAAGQFALEAARVARLVTEPFRRAFALARVAQAVAASGDHAAARGIAREAESAAGLVPDAWDRGRALAAVADAVARSGDHVAACQIAASITNLNRSYALVWVSRAVARSGDHTTAQKIAASITNPTEQDRALAAVVEAVAESADHVAALEIAATMNDPFYQAEALGTVAQAVAQSGDVAAAREIAAQAQAVAYSDSDIEDEDRMLGAVAEAVARAGDHVAAREIAASLTKPSEQAHALAAVVEAVAQSGDLTVASEIAVQAQAVAYSIPADTWGKDGVLRVVAKAVARAGDHVAAREIAASITDAHDQDWALTAVAAAAARSGELRAAREIAASITDSHEQVKALAAVQEVLEQSGDLAAAGEIAGEAKAMAYSISDSLHRDRALHAVAQAAAESGDHAAARDIAASITPDFRDWALRELAGTVARLADHTAARDIAASITNLRDRARALAAVAQAVAQTGELGAACEIASEAESAARSIPDDDSDQAEALAAVAQARALSGDLAAAREIAASITPGRHQALALAAVAEAIARSGDHPEDVPDLLEAVVLPAVADSEANTSPKGAVWQELTYKAPDIAAIVESLVDRGKLSVARALVARAWTVGCPWYQPVGVLAKLDRQLLDEIAAEAIDRP